MTGLMDASCIPMIAEDEFLSLVKNRVNSETMLNCITMLKNFECLKDVPYYYYGKSNEQIFAVLAKNLEIAVELDSENDIFLSCIDHSSPAIFSVYLAEYSIESEHTFRDFIFHKMKE